MVDCRLEKPVRPTCLMLQAWDTATRQRKIKVKILPAPYAFGAVTGAPARASDGLGHGGEAHGERPMVGGRVRRFRRGAHGPSRG